MNDYLSKISKKPYVNIVRPIEKEDLFDIDEISDEYLKYECVKFVPASGAATRMFSHLYSFLDTRIKTKEVEEFLNNIEKFAFYDDIRDKVKELNELELVEYILKFGLHYGDLPKALIKMHKYDTYIATPIDEHIYEAKEYLNKESSRIHFTISPEHEARFNDYLKHALKSNENIKIDYSFQDKSTDTLAIDGSGKPFILANGQYLYRPAGHGALLQNLNNIDADIIFIKNIDNVCHRSHIYDTIISKKKLASIGIILKAKIDKFIKDIINNSYNLDEINRFLKNVLKIEVNENLDKDDIFKLLDRPLRVVGVVQNTGEPGGGPFIVDDGKMISPQIVEMAEINLEVDIDKLLKSKYFNPVDIVCFVKDYKGEKYDLHKFVNHERYMIVEKTFEGKRIKSLELPGLWNGSMHYWNTVFVEVPLSTFNPVKTVNDLLRDKHLKDK